MAESASDTAEIIYPPELSAKVPCWRCGGSGQRPDKPSRGTRWAMPECSSCGGSGEVDRKHYAYCKRRECIGCLPTIDEIEAMPTIAVWGEMLTRCIEQSPATKTHEGAVAAVRECDGWYHSTAYFARLHTFAEQDAERLRDALREVLDAYDGFVEDRNLYTLSVHCDSSSKPRALLTADRSEHRS